MSWEYCLEERSDHWVFNFILNNQTNNYTKIKNLEWLKLEETVDYQELFSIRTFRVYKDKFERLHYFTFSTKEDIKSFFRANNLSSTGVHLETDQKLPRYRCHKIRVVTQASNFILYFLPQRFVAKRHIS